MIGIEIWRKSLTVQNILNQHFHWKKSDLTSDHGDDSDSVFDRISCDPRHHAKTATH